MNFVVQASVFKKDPRRRYHCPDRTATGCHTGDQLRYLRDPTLYQLPEVGPCSHPVHSFGYPLENSWGPISNRRFNRPTQHSELLSPIGLVKSNVKQTLSWWDWPSQFDSFLSLSQANRQPQRSHPPQWRHLPQWRHFPQRRIVILRAGGGSIVWIQSAIFWMLLRRINL